jgi:hypothetical protein
MSPIAQAQAEWAQKMRSAYPDPMKEGWQSRLGSVLLPGLVGLLAGGSGREAMLYGLGSAAYNFSDQLNQYRGVRDQIAEAEASLPGAELQYANQMTDIAYKMGGGPRAAAYSGRTEKGENGNLWAFNKELGRMEDTGVRFYKEPIKPNMTDVETIDDNGNPVRVFVDKNDAAGMEFRKPPTATDKKISADAADTLSQLDASERSFANQVAAVTGIVGRASGDVSALTSGPLARLLAKTGMNVPHENLRGDIDTLQGNLAFLELANMRANSPTGAALGSITERELQLLSSTVSSLSQNQSPERLRDNLMKIRDHLNRVQQLMGEGFAIRRQQLRDRAGSAQSPTNAPPLGGVPGAQIVPPGAAGSVEDRKRLLRKRVQDGMG